MLLTKRVMLLPNKEQETKMFQFAGAARYAYNWALEQSISSYEETGKSTNNGDLRKMFTQHRKENVWLQDISNNVTKQAIRDLGDAYDRFFKKLADYPNFKSRKKTKPSFYMDPVKIQFTGTHVKLEKIATSLRKNRQKANWIRLAEKNVIPVDAKYSNPRIKYDGKNWWLTVGIETDLEPAQALKSYISKISSEAEGVGIDLGIKDLAICSDGHTYKNINKSKKVRKLEKKLKRQQRKQTRRLRQNIKKYRTDKKGYKHPMWKRSLENCKNFQKAKKGVAKTERRLTSIRNNYLHQVTTEIINREPRFICIEDLNVKGMMKNHHLAKAVQDQGFGEFRRQIVYKAELHSIPVVIADRWFPSSRMCSKCGEIHKGLKLSDRTFVCPSCGYAIDRDYQASINLMNYGEKELNA